MSRSTRSSNKGGPLLKFQKVIARLLAKKKAIKAEFSTNTFSSKLATKIVQEAYPKIKKRVAVFQHIFNIFKSEKIPKYLKEEKDFANTLRPLRELMRYWYSNANTITGYYVNIRREIRKQLGLKGLRFDDDKRVKWTFEPNFGDPRLTAELNEEKSKIKKTRLDPSKATKINLSKVLNIINEFKDSPDWAKRFIACQLAIHARGIEILKSSKYSKVDDNTILVNGVAKESEFAKEKLRKQGVVDTKKRITKRLVGMTSDEFLDGIKFIREERKEFIDKWGDNLIKLGNSSRGPITRRGELVFGKPFKPKSLRHIGANASFALYAPKGTDRIPYLQKVLGHESSETSKWYASVRVINDLNKPQENDVQKDNVLNGELIPVQQVKINKDDIKGIKLKVKIDLKYPTLVGDRSLTKEQKISNIKKLMAKGVKTFRDLKGYKYGSAIIKQAKA